MAIGTLAYAADIPPQLLLSMSSIASGKLVPPMVYWLCLDFRFSGAETEVCTFIRGIIFLSKTFLIKHYIGFSFE